MTSSIDGTQLFERRRRVIGRLFMRAARVFQHRAVERIHERGHTDYRVGDNVVLVNLEMRGSRASELAERSGVTKQAVSQLVRDLEKRGIVRKEPDPADGRAQLVKFTDKGEAMMMDAFDVVFDLDDEFAELLPPGRLDALRADLTTLLEALEPEGF